MVYYFISFIIINYSLFLKNVKLCKIIAKAVIDIVKNKIYN